MYAIRSYYAARRNCSGTPGERVSPGEPANGREELGLLEFAPLCPGDLEHLNVREAEIGEVKILHPDPGGRSHDRFPVNTKLENRPFAGCLP